MTRSPELVALGETMALVAPDPPRPLGSATTLVLGHAGAESNLALGLARLGTPTAFCTRLGDDPFGERIVRDLRAGGVDTSTIRIDTGARTGVMFKDPGAAGTSVRYYRDGSAAAAMDATDAARALATGAGVVHLTGITPALSTSCSDAVDAAIAGAHGRGMHVSFDVNLRPALWPDPAVAAATLRELAQACDTVFVGLDEAHALWGSATPPEVRGTLDRCAVLIVKDGAGPATAFAESGVIAVPAEACEVVEAVGAGDAFAAGWWHARLAGGGVGAALRAAHRSAARVLGSPTDHPREVGAR